MNTQEFLRRLKVNASLPGVIAHQKMMPQQRPFSRAEIVNIDSYRYSAVGIVCYSNSENEIEFLLIERPLYDGVHSGQIALPGGKVDATDESYVAAAKREVWEEVGIQMEQDVYTIEMTEMFIPVSLFIVKPYLFYLPSLPKLILSEREVKQVFYVKMDDLLDEDSVKQTDIKMSNQMVLRNVPYFELQTKIVWGATAVILGELKDMLR